jgi:hypothetical protein
LSIGADRTCSCRTTQFFGAGDDTDGTHVVLAVNNKQALIPWSYELNARQDVYKTLVGPPGS